MLYTQQTFRIIDNGLLGFCPPTYTSNVAYNNNDCKIYLLILDTTEKTQLNRFCHPLRMKHDIDTTVDYVWETKMECKNIIEKAQLKRVV